MQRPPGVQFVDPMAWKSHHSTVGCVWCDATEGLHTMSALELILGEALAFVLCTSDQLFPLFGPSQLPGLLVETVVEEDVRLPVGGNVSDGPFRLHLEDAFL